MKQLLTVAFLFFNTHAIFAQRYALLDKHFTEPVHYADKITSEDKFKGFFPVEKKSLPQFLNILKAIHKKLSSKPPFGDVSDYEMGCIKFEGSVVFLSGEERIDYVITSTCDNVKISMHLADARRSNASNAFFIKVWIKYIEAGSK